MTMDEENRKEILIMESDMYDQVIELDSEKENVITIKQTESDLS